MPAVMTMPRRNDARDPQEGLWTLKVAAAYLGVAPGTLKSWALRRLVEYVKVGKFMRFTREALDRYIASQTIAPEPRP